MKTFFITGTDTNVGKTYITVELLNYFNTLGYLTYGMKPIAAGCHLNQQGKWLNEDALALQTAASIKQDYNKINPIALPDAIAPHLAAKKIGLSLSAELIANIISQSLPQKADINLIEGAGGWYVPINHQQLFSDVAMILGLPVILVIGLKLGCLNHAILTVQNMLAKNVQLIGWIGNCIDPNMLAQSENIITLQEWLPIPLLSIVPYQGKLTYLSKDLIKNNM